MFRVGSQVVIDRPEAMLIVPPYLGFSAAAVVVVGAFDVDWTGAVAGADVVLFVVVADELPHEERIPSAETREHSTNTTRVLNCPSR